MGRKRLSTKSKIKKKILDAFEDRRDPESDRARLPEFRDSHEYIPVTKRGRPKLEIDLTEEERIERMAAVGLTSEQMSAILGMSKRTFERRMKESPKLSDALARGRAHAAEYIASTAYRMAQYNYKMTQFWLRTQAGWKETSALELSGANGTQLIPDNLTDEEIERRREKVLSRIKR